MRSGAIDSIAAADSNRLLNRLSLPLLRFAKANAYHAFSPKQILPSVRHPWWGKCSRNTQMLRHRAVARITRCSNHVYYTPPLRQTAAFAK